MTAKVPEISTVIITVEKEDYTLDVTEFTPRECGVLKRVGHVAGVAALAEALPAGDLEAIVALAIIAAKRAGVTLDPEALLDGKLGTIKFTVPEEKIDPCAPGSES